MTSASTDMSSSGVLTSTGVAPASPSTNPCSRKSPCSARTPTFTGPAYRAVPFRWLPAAGLELLLELGDLLAAHRLTQPGRHLREDVGVVEVGGGLDDGPGSRCRVVALEDAATHQVPLRAELHHQRGVGRRGDAAGREVHHRELAGRGDLADQLERRAEVLRGADQLLRAEGGQ